MSKAPEKLFEELLAEAPSVDGVRAGFRELAESIVRSQKNLEEKRKKIEEDVRNGARLTKHRFHL